MKIIPLFLIKNSNKANSFLEVKLSGEWIKQNSDISDVVVSASRPQTAYYSERNTHPVDLRYYENYSDGEEGFTRFLKDYQPRYLILSVFEPHPEWAFAYPQKHNESIYPIQAYPPGQQPTLIIYEIDYTKGDLSQDNLESPQIEFSNITFINFDEPNYNSREKENKNYHCSYCIEFYTFD